MDVAETEAAQRGIERAARWHDLMAEEEARKAKEWRTGRMPVPAHKCEERAQWHRDAAASIREMTS